MILKRKQTYRPEIFVKFIVLVGLLCMPVLIFRWGQWIPFAGGSLYLLWELDRINNAFCELADLWNEQYAQHQVSPRDATLR
ncbi:hypothetical protein ACYF6T_40805 [Streptomyces sp. 7R007]